MSRARTAAEQLIRTVEARDADAYAELFAEDAVSHHPLAPGPIRGRAEIRAVEEELYDAFSDVRVEVRSLVVDGPQAVAEVVLRARHAGPMDLGDGQVLDATGREIAVPATWWLKVDEQGRITEERDYFDAAALLAQLDGA